jgi:hypothetical protein
MIAQPFDINGGGIVRGMVSNPRPRGCKSLHLHHTNQRKEAAMDRYNPPVRLE